MKKARSPRQSDHLQARYSPGSDAEGTCNFRVERSTIPVITWTMDAEPGIIMTFNRTVQKTGRPCEPAFDITAAEVIARRYISGRNGPVAVNMSDGRYYPLGNPSVAVSGYSTFIYNRIINNNPGTRTCSSWVLILQHKRLSSSSGTGLLQTKPFSVAYESIEL
ncbi:MAG: hypothetical protein WCF90_00705 [Methanomicrobiales archaeon]